MKYDFITYLRLNEAVKDKVFNVVIDGIEYTVDRRCHLLKKRTGDNKPKDLAKAERLHRKAMETEQKVTDTINNMPALFMPTVD